MKKGFLAKNFIYIFALVVLLILGLALLGAFLMGDKDLINNLTVPFVTTLGAISGMFFNKDRSEDKDI